MQSKPRRVSRQLVWAVIAMVATVLVILAAAGRWAMAVTLLVTFAALFIIDALLVLLANRVRFGWAIKVVAAVVTGVVCLGVTITLVASAMFYYPHGNQAAHDALLANPRMEQVEIGPYTGWYVDNASGRAPLVIFFSGNGQCADDVVALLDQGGHWGSYDGFDFMTINYPGYGTSRGQPSQQSIYQMALAGYDYAVSRTDVDPARIVVQGYSLGAPVATYLASQRTVAGLVLLAPMDRGLSMYNATLNIFHGPLELLATQRFDAMTYARSVTVAPLLITSTDDEMINSALSEHLAEFFPTRPELHVLSGIHHNDYLSSPQVWDLVSKYLGESR